MNGRAKAMVAVLALVLLWLVWGRALGGMRGDPEAVAEAVEAAEAAEAAAEQAASQTAAAQTEHDRLAAGSADVVAFAVTLPEIAVHDEHPLRRWYERTLMTPAELRAYDSDGSDETLEFGEPVWWTSNPSCIEPAADDSGDGDEAGVFSFEACAPSEDVTVVIGAADVEISLAGWNGDCRLALGWLFSRFVQSVNLDGVTQPSGYHLQPWVQPGSFEADAPNCLGLPDQIEALRQALGVVWGQWPVTAEEYAEGTDAEGADAGSAAGRPDSEDAEIRVTVRFTLLFRPAHPLLCVPRLVGYLDDSGQLPEDAAECPAAARIEAEAAARTADGPLISDRVCLPRLPVATVVDRGDAIVARWDPDGWPPADGAWPDDLEGCEVRPVSPRRPAGADDADGTDSDSDGVPDGGADRDGLPS